MTKSEKIKEKKIQEWNHERKAGEKFLSVLTNRHMLKARATHSQRKIYEANVIVEQNWECFEFRMIHVDEIKDESKFTIISFAISSLRLPSFCRFVVCNFSRQSTFVSFSSSFTGVDVVAVDLFSIWILLFVTFFMDIKFANSYLVSHQMIASSSSSSMLLLLLFLSAAFSRQESEPKSLRTDMLKVNLAAPKSKLCALHECVLLGPFQSIE